MHILLSRRVLLICLLGVFIMLNACRHSKLRSEKITIESGEIPPDMATEKFILIGRLEKNKSYNKQLEKEFDAYTGEKVLATQAEIDEKYTYANGYRYVLDYDIQYQKHYQNGSYVSIEVKRFYIYDQKTDKKYTRNTSSSFWKLQIRYYLLAIENARLK